MMSSLHVTAQDTYHGDSWQVSVHWLWGLENTASVTCDDMTCDMFTFTLQLSNNQSKSQTSIGRVYGVMDQPSLFQRIQCLFAVQQVLTVFWLASTSG